MNVMSCLKSPVPCVTPSCLIVLSVRRLPPLVLVLVMPTLWHKEVQQRFASATDEWTWQALDICFVVYGDGSILSLCVEDFILFR